ncbi:unnamed protein product [Ambrosiozyma monospora]|uniref:Unnamed protein product n=1 Tax=Ambrosiozyma monospora TaxID=43982 RepID=A0ACB5SXB3_AMBMO|nr:unnamed protein product [Ambrosiozyma monospora]
MPSKLRRLKVTATKVPQITNVKELNNCSSVDIVFPFDIKPRTSNKSKDADLPSRDIFEAMQSSVVNLPSSVSELDIPGVLKALVYLLSLLLHAQ